MYLRTGVRTFKFSANRFGDCGSFSVQCTHYISFGVLPELTIHISTHGGIHIEALEHVVADGVGACGVLKVIVTLVDKLSIGDRCSFTM